jgi:mannitol-1-/sugar-/sorbitol-6-phosphatase
MQTRKQIRCRAILFDLDGVLVDSIASVERNWREWARIHDLDQQTVLGVIHGRRAEDGIRLLAPELPLEVEMRRIEAMEIADIANITAMPGAVKLLSQLPRSSWTVVTSGSRALASARLRAAGLPVPAAFVSADDVSHGKPDPEGYLKGAEILGIEPEQCIVIEDRLPGIQAARAGHMHAIALGADFPLADQGQADAWISDLNSLQVEVDEDGKLSVQINSLATK